MPQLSNLYSSSVEDIKMPYLSFLTKPGTKPFHYFPGSQNQLQFPAQSQKQMHEGLQAPPFAPTAGAK